MYNFEKKKTFFIFYNCIRLGVGAIYTIKDPLTIVYEESDTM